MISMLRRAVLLAAAVAVSGSLPAVAAVAAVPAWTVTVAPAPAATGTSSDGDIDCASGSFCVQVGTGVQLSADRNTTPIAVVHSGSVATAAELPLPIDAERPHTSSGLGAVDCVSTRYCVAVGSYGTYDGRGRALIETYRNGIWTASSVSSPTGYGLGLTDVACNVSSCVATGGFFDGTTEQPIIAARDSHGVWTVPSIVGAPYFFQVRAPVCPPDGPCYAQGYEYPGAGSSLQRARFLYPTAAGWSGVYFPTPPGADEHTLVVGTMACPSVDFCTGIGTYKDSATGKHRLVAEQFKQGRLTARPVATPHAIATSKGYPSATATSCGGESAGVPCVAAVTPNAGASWYVEFTAGRWSTEPVPPPPSFL